MALASAFTVKTEVIDFWVGCTRKHEVKSVHKSEMRDASEGSADRVSLAADAPTCQVDKQMHIIRGKYAV